MSPLVILFFLVAIPFMILVWDTIKKHISRVFPQDYKALKRSHPNPLKEFVFLNGSIGHLNCKGSLKLLVYPDKLIVGTMGKGLCLDYFAYSFTREDFLFLHYLVVGPLQVQAPKSGSGFWGFLDFKKDTNLKIQLSAADIDFIFHLVRQTVADTSAADTKNEQIG